MYLKKLDRGQGGHSLVRLSKTRFFGEKQVAVPYMGRLHPEGLNMQIYVIFAMFATGGAKESGTRIKDK